MHGQKRAEYKSRLLNPETSTKLATKAQQWNHLSSELLQQRRSLFEVGASTSDGVEDDDNATAASSSNKKPSPDILLSLTEKMLSVNPDPSHLWNIRREMLLYVPTSEAAARKNDTEDDTATKNTPTTKGPPSIDINAELSLTAHCLQRNPKSYAAWYHRKWSLVYFLTHPPTSTSEKITSTTATEEADIPSMGTLSLLPESIYKDHLNDMKTILKSELELCAQFLQMDERNFHCWNYRRFVVAILGSCGGSSSVSGTSTVHDKNIAIESDMELFNGSWSSWLTNQPNVSMGAQLSQGSMNATGIIRSGDVKEQDSSKGAHNIAKSIIPLSKQELEDIITNEWDFTTSKIQDNFSNGSAFHYRSKLLPLILESRLSSYDNDSNDSESPSKNERYNEILSLARDEWESILLNAIFTEPDDQTPWWYHRFIVSWAKPTEVLLKESDELVLEYVDFLYEMVNSLRELLEVEKENDGMDNNSEKRDESKGAKCKWAYIGLHLVLSTLLDTKSLGEEEAEELKEEAKECLVELMKIDPNRRERYQNLATDIEGP